METFSFFFLVLIFNYEILKYSLHRFTSYNQFFSIVNYSHQFALKLIKRLFYELCFFLFDPSSFFIYRFTHSVKLIVQVNYQKGQQWIIYCTFQIWDPCTTILKRSDFLFFKSGPTL